MRGETLNLYCYGYDAKGLKLRGGMMRASARLGSGVQIGWLRLPREINVASLIISRDGKKKSWGSAAE